MELMLAVAPPSPFHAAVDAGSSQALAGSGAGNICPTARASVELAVPAVSPHRPETTSKAPVSLLLLSIGLQGQSPDTAPALKPPVPGDKGPWGTKHLTLHFEPASRGLAEDRGGGGMKDTVCPWPAARITQNL